MYCSPIGHIMEVGNGHIARDCCCNTWPPNENWDHDCTCWGEGAIPRFFAPDCIRANISGFAGNFHMWRASGTAYNHPPYLYDYCCRNMNVDLSCLNTSWFGKFTYNYPCGWSSNEPSWSAGNVYPPTYHCNVDCPDPPHCIGDCYLVPFWPELNVWIEIDTTVSWSMNARILFSWNNHEYYSGVWDAWWRRVFSEDICNHDWTGDGFPMSLPEVVVDNIAIAPDSPDIMDGCPDSCDPDEIIQFTGNTGIGCNHPITDYACGTITLDVPGTCPPIDGGTFYGITVPAWYRGETALVACAQGV